MHHHYNDIRSRIPEEPTWFDEHAVPRYCPFSPNETADIYADECALLEVHCQSCERPFMVAVTCKSFDRYDFATKTRGLSLADRVVARKLSYGDPPNVDCCPAGPTMNGVEVRVVEFWRKERLKWSRAPDLEVDVTPDWAKEL